MIIGVIEATRAGNALEQAAIVDQRRDSPLIAKALPGYGRHIAVTEIDAAKGMVTLDHGDIAELQWPAMKMDFATKPELLAGIKVGDKVNFEIDWDGKAGTVTKIEQAEK